MTTPPPHALKRPPGSVPSRSPIWILAVSLIAFENTVAVITGGELFVSGVAAIGISAVLVAGVVIAARANGMTLQEVGIEAHGAIRGALIGTAIALPIAIGILVLLRTGAGFEAPVKYSPLVHMTTVDVFVRAAVFVPLATALPEELAFRGVLLALLCRRYSAGRATAISAVVFALWHGLVVFHTVGQTTLSQTLLGSTLGVSVGFLAVFAGGCLFAVLRLQTKNLTTSVVCHWVFNAAVLVGLYLAQN